MNCRRCTLFVVVLMLAGPGCDRGPSSDSKDDSDRSKETVQGAVDDATLTYGYAPIPNPSVTYQPDVIFIEGGPHAIRSVSADGIVWTIDGHAKGAKDLRPGSIMLATGRAAGRVIRLDPRGNDVAVTLGPANLGEILRDAHIEIDYTIPAKAFTYQYIPDLPGIYTDLEAATSTELPAYASLQHDSTTLREQPWIGIANAGLLEHGGGSALPTALKEAPKFKFGSYEVEVSIKDELKDNKPKVRIGLKILRKFLEEKLKFKDEDIEAKAGLKLGLEGVLWMSNLHIQCSLTYNEGQFFSKDFKVDFGNFDGLDVSIISGVADALKDNKKFKMEVPLEILYPIPPQPELLGIPFVVQLKFRWLIEIMLGGNNATASTSGGYKMSGSIGYANGKVVTPTITETKSLAEAVTGITLKPSGLVFAFEFRGVPLGIGIPAAFAGPYVKIVPSFGITKASDIGFLRCSAATVKIDAGAGVGVQVSSKAKQVFEKLFGKDRGIELELLEKLSTFYKSTSYYPDAKFCKF